MGKKVTCILIAVIVVSLTLFPLLNTITASATEAEGTSMRLWYDESASALNSYDTWQQTTLPIGNGILGANIYGEIGTEHLTINEETLWSGGRGSVSNYDGGNPDSSVKTTYDSLASAALSGSVSNIEALAGDGQYVGGYYDGYQPLGDLYFDFGHGNATNYLRELNLENAISTISYTYSGVTYSREFFASNPNNVIVSHFEADKSEKLSFTISFAPKQNADNQSFVDNNIGYLISSGDVDNNELLHNTQIAVVTEEGSVSASGSSVSVSNATSATVYLTAATDYKNTFYDYGETTEYYYRTGENADVLNARVRAVLDAAVADGYENVRADHIKDYMKLYDRVDLDLGQSNTKTTDALLSAYKSGSASAVEQRYLEVLLFQYGRYLLIAGSRENSQLPTNLQGLWNNNVTAPWRSDYHTNINLQMNYWLSNNCNLTECALPLVKYVADLDIPGGRTVEIYTGVKNGIMAHTQNTPFGYTAPGWSIGTWGWSPAASTWLMQNCFDYYEYSNDRTTLENIIYPMLKDQVLMYEKLLKEKDGRKVMPITQSPELDTITAGNTYEQSLIWQLYSDTIEAANILGLDQDSVNGWKETMDQLKPIEIGSSGQVKEWYTETSINSVNNTSGHRHLSNLLGLYPGNLFDTDEEISAATVSLNNKNFGRVGTSSNPEGGWTYGQMIPSWARVGNGENAYFCVKTMIQNRLYQNLWDWHEYGSNGAFQIDGNYGYSAGVAEMLMQSNLGFIDLLPAIPTAWNSGSVEGLLAEGNFEVDMTWDDGTVTEATIHSNDGGSCSVAYPGVGATDQVVIVDESGDEVEYTVSEGIYTFDTTADSEYTISVTFGPSIVRNADGTVTLIWDAKEDVTYTITRKKIK